MRRGGCGGRLQALVIASMFQHSHSHDHEHSLADECFVMAKSLWSAAQSGDTRRVSELITCRGMNPSSTDEAGYTALHYAARAGHSSTVSALLSAGANANATTPCSATPLHRAAYAGHLDIVKRAWPRPITS